MEKTIYLVPHSHYDVIWAFNKEDYLYINELILSKALEFMENSECPIQCFLPERC